MKDTLKCAVLFAMAAVAMGCSGGGGGDDDDDGGSFNESEPNDGLSSADGIGSATSFTGTCSETDIDDFFAIDVSAGTLSVTLTWTEGADENDVDLWLYDTTDTEAATDFGSPPGDSPAEVSSAVTAGTATVQVECFSVIGSVDYSVSVDRP